MSFHSMVCPDMPMPLTITSRRKLASEVTTHQHEEQQVEERHRRTPTSSSAGTSTTTGTSNTTTSTSTAAVGSGPICAGALVQWCESFSHLPLHRLPLDRPGHLRLQVHGFIGETSDLEDFRVILSDGQVWLKCRVVQNYANLIETTKVPDVHDIVEIYTTIGGRTDLLIVSAHF